MVSCLKLKFTEGTAQCWVVWRTGVAKTVDLLLVEGYCRLLTLNQNCLGWLTEQRASQAGKKWLALCLQIPGRAETRSYLCLVVLPPSAPGSVHSLQDRPGKPQHYFCVMVLWPYSCLLWSGTSSWCIFGSSLAPDKCPGSTALWSQTVIASITAYQGRFCSRHT